eukprot:CAMPEP_0174698724 /NCGR_PEP_ID=MMETSP1094-20130205/4232_1 /TAXON_ID=156173 /ORGANISM="Chrysochromulina brevifilum, Strain UTEX LB 985" /LENGTH=400 /DNA_ID=CAMNT_0015895947 /DNA_START=16 /DNA_END=1218 /DNA_ORIENTATION=+
MPPPSWKPCPHCGQQFGKSSLDIHVKRCTQRADVAAEHELRELEGYSRPAPLPDWDACVNCGEPYGPTAIAAHTKRCRRLRPNGANGFGPGGGAANEGAPEFQGLFGIGSRELAEAPPPPSEDDLDLDVLRAMFDKFDTNKDGKLDADEFGKLLCQMMPRRVGDFDDVQSNSDSANMELNVQLGDGTSMQVKLSVQFELADTDGSGDIDFDEFVAYWRSIATNSEFDDASDMFDFFDRDKSGELDRKEFLHCLNQIFPEHVEENERICDAEFGSADIDGSDGISYPEFIMYYNRMKALYDGKESEAEAAARKAAAKAAKLAALKEPLVKCKGCGMEFVTDLLDVHQRSCEAYEKYLRAQPAGGGGDQDSSADANGFVPCKYCARTFFPDRAPLPPDPTYS